MYTEFLTIYVCIHLQQIIELMSLDGIPKALQCWLIILLLRTSEPVL